MKKFTFRSPKVKFRENDLTESTINARANRTSVSSSSSSSGGGTIATTTTTTAAPTYYLGQQVYSGGTPTTGYSALTYAENVNIIFATTIVPSEYNYLYISLPDSKNYIIYNAADLNVTATFSEVGTYSVGGITNVIVRSDNQFSTDLAITYKVYIT